MTQKPAPKDDIPPYITHRIAEVPLLEYTGLYTDRDIQALCDRHNIPTEHRKLFGATLDYAAKAYAQLKQQESIRLPNADLNRFLTGLKRSAKALVAEIEQLPPKARQVFDEAERELLGEFEESIQENMIERRSASPSRMEQAGTGKYVIVGNGTTEAGWYNNEVRLEYTGHKDIEAALKQVALICETGLNRLQPEKGGRPENKALNVWVKRLSDFWMKSLMRPYKVDGYKGEVISDAGNFLTDCLKYLDPSAIDLLYSQMRRYKDGLNRPAA